jgi:YHS domain-containing protein
MKFDIRIALGLIVIAGALLTVQATGASKYATTDGLALGGFDPVAYTTAGEPLQGSAEFTTEWKGSTWQFANERDLELFRHTPKHYVPAYGGYCPTCLLHDKLAAGNPEAWKMVEATPHLFCSEKEAEGWDNSETATYKARTSLRELTR